MPAALFALSRRGRLLRELPLAGATNVDWEDIAARGDTLYVGDIGDNAASRPEIAVYRVAGATVRRIALRYPDGPHDAEALLVDRSGALVIVTKSVSGEAGVYTGRAGTLRRVGGLSLGLGEAVTGGDSAGRTVVLRTYDRAYVFTGASVVRALRRTPCTAGASLLAEGQGEALALAPDARSFYTLPEGDRPTLRQYVSQH